MHSANNNSLLNLNQIPEASRYCVAFSGGLDSSALLHMATQNEWLKSKIFAIHVNHNINQDSTAWAKHCQQVCDQYGIELIIETLQLDNHSEHACREGRFSAYARNLTKEDCLLTGHHANDQLETVLFRLFRGTGIKGLTGIHQARQVKNISLYSPLIEVSKEDLVTYAHTHQLSYIQDPSNLDDSYSRNFIRNQIIPKLESYQHDAITNINLTTKNLTSTQQLLSHVIGYNNPFIYADFTTKNLLASALYQWLDNLKIIVPSHKKLNQFATDCLTAAQEKSPRLDTGDYYLLRWGGQIYALIKRSSNHSNTKILLINNKTIRLNNGCGDLLLIAKNKFEQHAIIKYQQTTESLILAGNSMHKSIKNIFQENRIPPWQRACIPYLYINDQLMAVGDQFISVDFKRYLVSHNAEYQWLSPHFLL